VSTLDTLIDRFKNKKKRWESDCLVITEIQHLCLITTLEDERKDAIRWLMATLEDKKSNALVKNNIRTFLIEHRALLTEKRQKHLDKYLRKYEEKKAHKKTMLFER
jgi:hypothetical protein